MGEFTPEQVRTMAEALDLSMSADDLAEVTHRLNALLEALEPLRALPLEAVEPVPIALDEPGAP